MQHPASVHPYKWTHTHTDEPDETRSGRYSLNKSKKNRLRHTDKPCYLMVHKRRRDVQILRRVALSSMDRITSRLHLVHRGIAPNNRQRTSPVLASLPADPSMFFFVVRCCCGGGYSCCYWWGWRCCCYRSMSLLCGVSLTMLYRIECEQRSSQPSFGNANKTHATVILLSGVRFLCVSIME